MIMIKYMRAEIFGSGTEYEMFKEEYSRMAL